MHSLSNLNWEGKVWSFRVKLADVDYAIPPVEMDFMTHEKTRGVIAQDFLARVTRARAIVRVKSASIL